MAFDQRGLDDYVDVAQRIADFRERYPEGSLQPADLADPFEIRQIEGVDKNGKQFAATFIIYRAAAYRTPDDQRPGIGMAWEVFPGRTPYTLGSELMNAETSAWGRAIIAVLASDSKRGVASREEIRNRAAERDEPGTGQGESFETATPAPPPAHNAGNGQPAASADPAQWENADPGETDELAQEIAQAAHEARTVRAVSDEHAKAHEAGKLNAWVTDPAKGVRGRLGAYLKFRRQQVGSERKALTELEAAGKAVGVEGDLLDARVQELVGVGIEAATVAQMKEAAAKLASTAKAGAS